MKRRIIHTGFALCLTFSSSLTSFGQEGLMKTKPYLQNPTDNGITVSWLTNKKVHSWVEYGTHPDSLIYKAERLVDGQSFCYNTIHHVRLKALTPGKKYYYRVASREITLYAAYKKEFGEPVYSDIYPYNPVPVENHDFNAVVFNDLHKNEKTLARLADQIDLNQLDLIFFNGDCIDDPKDEDSVLKFMNFVHDKLNASSVPVIYIRGNHEIRNAYSIQLRDLIDYIGGETSYGAFSFGGTRFVMLDCGEDKPDDHWVYYGLNSFESFRNEQTEFLREELRSKAHKRAMNRVLIHHIPIYGYETEYEPCRELWSPLLQKSKFDIALNAHTHEYKYLHSGEDQNRFPVVIGGGPKQGDATVMILRKTGKVMTAEIKNDSGKTLDQLEL
ncbi:MAG: metallophosphoesterase [Bacteroidales bacterium]